MMKSEMGWVLQHLIDHGFCRDPIRRLGWQIGKVGFPIHFAGDKVEWQCTVAGASKSCANGSAEEVILATTHI